MTQLIHLGEGIIGGYEQSVGISPKDLRQHLYIIGKTGSGKTTLLFNIAAQYFSDDRGFAIVDPHGDLAEEILTLIPENKILKTIYFNAGDTSYPIASWRRPTA